MTKYTVAARRGAKAEEKQLPAIWSAIGCVMFIVIPVMSFVGAQMIVQMAVDQDWPVPYQLMGAPMLPKEIGAIPSLYPLVLWWQAQTNLYAILLVTVVLIVLIGGIIAAVYGFMYQAVGPSRYGPLDMPPLKTKMKRYKR